MAKERKFSLRRDILAAEWLAGVSFTKQIPFFFYVAFLLILYMSLNQSIVNINRIKNRNSIEIKHLKANYTSKVALLQNQSSRRQIIEKLKANGSTLKNPVNPASNLKRTSNGKY